MNGLERLELIDLIARELQSRMTYADIDVYLSGHGIDCSKVTTNVNSKWVYSKDVLAGVEDNLLFKISDELNLNHNYTLNNTTNLVIAPKFWKDGYLKLFISHLSSFKTKTALLQKTLLDFGISSFVAHNDIEPTKEWQNEIEKAMFTMDALLAILMPGFKESNWTDQEMGVAIGRDVLIIPIKKGLNPYGFVGKYQALQGANKSVSEVAEAIYQILLTNPKTKNKMMTSLVNLLLFSKTSKDALRNLSLIKVINDFPIKLIETIKENALNNDSISKSENVRSNLNELLSSYGLDSLESHSINFSITDDDVPF